MTLQRTNSTRVGFDHQVFLETLGLLADTWRLFHDRFQPVDLTSLAEEFDTCDKTENIPESAKPAAAWQVNLHFVKGLDRMCLVFHMGSTKSPELYTKGIWDEEELQSFLARFMVKLQKKAVALFEESVARKNSITA